MVTGSSRTVRQAGAETGAFEQRKGWRFGGEERRQGGRPEESGGRSSGTTAERSDGRRPVGRRWSAQRAGPGAQRSGWRNRVPAKWAASRYKDGRSRTAEGRRAKVGCGAAGAARGGAWERGVGRTRTITRKRTERRGGRTDGMTETVRMAVPTPTLPLFYGSASPSSDADGPRLKRWLVGCR